MSREWLTLRFPKEENGDFSPKCAMCDGVIMVPRNPQLLLDGVLYLEGSIITGPTCINDEIVYVVDYDKSLLRDQTKSINQCEFMICCNDCSAKMVKLITQAQNARIAALEAAIQQLLP